MTNEITPLEIRSGLVRGVSDFYLSLYAQRVGDYREILFTAQFEGE
jgi:hypothetical protein